LVRLAGVGDERLAVSVTQHADADHREARRGGRLLGRRRLHLLAGLLPAGIEEIPVDDRRDQGGGLNGDLLVRPPSLAAAASPPFPFSAPSPFGAGSVPRAPVSTGGSERPHVRTISSVRRRAMTTRSPFRMPQRPINVSRGAARACSSAAPPAERPWWSGAR